MGLKIYHILANFLIFYNVYLINIVNAIPMVGQNVREVEQGEFPFVVSVKPTNFMSTEPEKDHGSTGILISRQDVLTTDHMLHYLAGSIFEIIVGSNDIRTGRKHFPWWWLNFDKWAKIYEQPNTSTMNDIAIIRLTKAVSEDITPIVLSPLVLTDLYGLHVSVTGWGKTSNGEVSRYMRSALVKVIDNRFCEYRMLVLRGLESHVPDNIMCSIAEPYAIMGDGDSGGPLMFNGALVGIHKGTCLYPENCFHPNKINIHLSIDHYRTFIHHFQQIP